MLIDLTHTLVSAMPVYPGDSSPVVEQSAWVEKDGFTHYDLKVGVHTGTHMDGPAHMVVGGKKLCEFPVDRFVTTGKLLSIDASFSEGDRLVHRSLGEGGGDFAPLSPLNKQEDVKHRRTTSDEELPQVAANKGGRGDFQVTKEHLEKINLQPGDTLLIRTGFSDQFNDPSYFTNYPVITEEAAMYMVEKKIGILGIDWSSPDHEPFLVHKILLSAEILIIENLTNLGELAKLVLPSPRGGADSERSEEEAEGSFTLYTLPLKVDADSAPCRVIASTQNE